MLGGPKGPALTSLRLAPARYHDPRDEAGHAQSRACVNSFIRCGCECVFPSKDFQNCDSPLFACPEHKLQRGIQESEAPHALLPPLPPSGCGIHVSSSFLIQARASWPPAPSFCGEPLLVWVPPPPPPQNGRLQNPQENMTHPQLSPLATSPLPLNSHPGLICHLHL